MTDTNQEFDEFHLDTGLKDDYDGTVIDEWFGTTPGAGESTLFLFLKIQADDGEEVERRYSCGDDWQTFDGGKTAEHPSKKFFNTNSNVGMLMTKAFACGGEADLRERSKTELNHMGPRAAALWHGTKWHWNVETEDMKFKDRETGQMVERTVNRVLPTKYLGTGDVAAAATPQSNQVSGTPQAQAAPSESPGAAAGPLSNASPAIAAQVKALAKANDYATWIDKVMQLPGVLADDTLMAGISDESFYDQLKNH